MKYACLVPVAPDPLEDETLLRAYAVRSLTLVAVKDRREIIPASVIETHRSPCFYYETGELDADGEPMRTMLPMSLAAPSQEPDVWMLRYEGRVR